MRDRPPLSPPDSECNTLAAGLAFGHQLWFGTERNVGRSVAHVADEVRIDIHVIET